LKHKSRHRQRKAPQGRRAHRRHAICNRHVVLSDGGYARAKTESPLSNLDEFDKNVYLYRRTTGAEFVKIPNGPAREPKLLYEQPLLPQPCTPVHMPASTLFVASDIKRHEHKLRV
jgi:hypothetical protein